MRKHGVLVLVVLWAVGCGEQSGRGPGGEVGQVVSASAVARGGWSPWPQVGAAGREPIRYTSSLDRRTPWTPEAVESLLDRSQSGGDPLLLALRPGSDPERLERIPGLRVTARHAFGIVAAEVVAPGRALAQELIGLTDLQVLALDDRLHTTREAEPVLRLEQSNDILVTDPVELDAAGDAVANDPLYVNQWQLWGGPRESLGPFGETTPTSHGGANVPPAWGKLTDARSVTVAVIDTGADSEHVDLGANLLEGEQVGIQDGPILVRRNTVDDDGHGTMVAGVIGALGNNGLGTAGVCWRAKIFPIRAEVDGVIRLSAVVDGIYRAILEGARVINISLGTEDANILLYSALSFAHRQRVLVVASAGNEGLDLDVEPRYPASYDLPNLITVAALDRDGNLAEFSNYGKQTVDIAAPGVQVFTTFPGDRVAITSGTSFAAPMVAGTLALIMAKRPDKGMKFVRERLFEYARQPEVLRGKVAGRRQLDTGRAVRPKRGRRD